MPFDGVVAKAIVEELNKELRGGRISKVTQPERDELIFHIRSNGKNHKLLCTSNSSFPRIHITSASRENPMKAPMFCMLLRKHLGGGNIISFAFHDFERIIDMEVEATDELGDKSVKRLVIEIMGRHSNIMLLHSNGTIMDAIKHIDSELNRVREIMPARPYILPPAQNKTSPSNLNPVNLFTSAKRDMDITIEKYLLKSIKGFSPVLCSEICNHAGIDGRLTLKSLSDSQIDALIKSIRSIISDIADSRYYPCIIRDKSQDKMIDFHCLPLEQYPELQHYGSISEAIDVFYMEKDKSERLRQKTSDLVKLIQNNLDRCTRKLNIHQETLSDSQGREKYQLFGELITANIYQISKGANMISLLNYYTNEPIDIPMNENKSPQENAQIYFNKYQKSKKAFTHAKQQIEDTRMEIEYLESVLHLLNNCSTLDEIKEVRDELTEQGYIRKNTANKKKQKTNKASSPVSYMSSDGFEILVGKNNRQNDILTLKTAYSSDIWLHTKNIPGSHVIIRVQGRPVPDSTLLEAAGLAAWFSKAKQSPKVEVDYTEVRNVKKPNGAKPGMVIYVNYRTVVVEPVNR